MWTATGLSLPVGVQQPRGFSCLASIALVCIFSQEIYPYIHAKFWSSAFLSFLAASSSRFRRCSSCLFWSSYCQVVVKAICSYPRSNTLNAINAKNYRVPVKCLQKVCRSAIIWAGAVLEMLLINLSLLFKPRNESNPGEASWRACQKHSKKKDEMRKSWQVQASRLKSRI